MISVEEATERVRAAIAPVGFESVPIAKAAGRILAVDAIAKVAQPPDDVSSMDGYAVRSGDAREPGRRLKVIGSAPAGHPFRGLIGENEAVRIFTGAPLPEGADTIVIQEHTSADDGFVILNSAAPKARHIRSKGIDFSGGDILAPVGRRLTARDLSLLAAADIPTVEVRRKPRVLYAATGDELSRPGEPRKPGGIVASSGYGLSALIDRWGGEPVDFGILPDSIEAIATIAGAARAVDLVVTIGGASVGDHDLVQRALGPKGFALDFWKIAMRPGKPLIFGKLGGTPLMGLPGNPVSSLVCAILFLRPAIDQFLGIRSNARVVTAKLGCVLAANDSRQDYIRASHSFINGEDVVEPFPIQDSSMLSVFARADRLIVRKPFAPESCAGDKVEVLTLD